MSKKTAKKIVYQLQSEFKAKTQNQAEYVRSIVENDVTFCYGPPGCGKSAVSVGLACSWLAQEKISKIVITRPIVEVGKKGLGYLPGDMLEKVHPYLIPLLDEMEKYFSPFTIDELLHKGIIDVVPLEYMRGRNFHNSFMILDEAQNATYDQIKMFLTRIGQESRAVVNGDIGQSDLGEKDRAMANIMQRLENLNGVGIVELTEKDILRSGIIARILSRL